ncbi:MAG: hypothetical protein HZA48_09005 [Planctomycetes bacterium]|nr:hypothetical protein [Planctomycetota bacterium]
MELEPKEQNEKTPFTTVRKTDVIIMLAVLPLLTALVLIFVVLPALVNKPAVQKQAPLDNAQQAADDKIHKPQNQIAMNMILQKKPEKAGDTGEILLIVTPQIDAPGMNIYFEIPGKLSPSGELEWTGDLVSGETKTLTAGFTLPDDVSYEINAGAWIKSLKSGKTANAKRLSVGTGKAKTSAPKGEENTNDKGQKIIEFEVPQKK